MNNGNSPPKPRFTEFLSKHADSLEAFIQEEVKQRTQKWQTLYNQEILKGAEQEKRIKALEADNLALKTIIDADPGSAQSEIARLWSDNALLVKVQDKLKKGCQYYKGLAREWQAYARKIEERNRQKAGERQHSGSSLSAKSTATPQDSRVPPAAPKEQEPQLSKSLRQHAEGQASKDTRPVDASHPTHNPEETLDPEDHDTETSSGQESAHPANPLDKDKDTANSNRTAHVTQPDSSPVFVSARSLKRKRTSPPPAASRRRSAGDDEVDDTDGALNNDKGRHRIKNESPDSSPTVPLPHRVLLGWNDSLDLDDIGQHTRTPRKKKKRVRCEPKIEEEEERRASIAEEVDDADADDEQQQQEQEENDSYEEEEDEDHASRGDNSCNINEEPQRLPSCPAPTIQQQRFPTREIPSLSPAQQRAHRERSKASATVAAIAMPGPLQQRDVNTVLPRTSEPLARSSSSRRQKTSRSSSGNTKRRGSAITSAYFISMLAEDGDDALVPRRARSGAGGKEQKENNRPGAANGGRDTAAAQEMTGGANTERQTRLQTLLSGPTPDRSTLSIMATARPSSVGKERREKGGGGAGVAAGQTVQGKETTPALARKDARDHPTTTSTAAACTTGMKKPPPPQQQQQQQQKKDKQDSEKQRETPKPFSAAAAALQKPQTKDSPAQGDKSYTPLRHRPLDTLRLTDFKVNPNHRFDSYHRPAQSYGSGGGRRATEGRACTDPFCQRCKDMASFAEISGFMPTGSKKGLFDPSQSSPPDSAERPGPNNARGAAPAVGEEEEEGDEDDDSDEVITMTQQERERRQAEENHILRTFLPPSHPLPSLHDPDRAVLLRQARTKLFASHFSKHRPDRSGGGGGRGRARHTCSRSGGHTAVGADRAGQYGRAVTPPGFWDTEMQTTQEMRANQELGEKQDRERIKERWSEAMKNTPPAELGRGGRRKDAGVGGEGAWKFADE